MRSAFEYWNKLPEEIMKASSVEIFKLRLDARWQSLFPEAPLLPVKGSVYSYYRFELEKVFTRVAWDMTVCVSMVKG